MLGLGTKLGARHERKQRFFTYGPAVIQLDATTSKSASASVWKDLKGLADFNATNASLTNGGEPGGYYSLSGTGYFRPSSNPSILANLHKTTSGNAWTIVMVGQTNTIDNKWLFGSVNGTAGQNGFGIKWQGDTDLQYSQYTAGTGVIPTPNQLPNSAEFILIVSRDVNTNTYRVWMNDYNTFEFSSTWNANTNNPDGIFTLGGLPDGGQFNGRLYGFMVLDEFIDVYGARSIINYYNKIHDRTYVTKPFNVLFAGQSNVEKLFSAYSGAGSTQFATTAGTYYSAVNVVNGAKGSAAVHYAAAGAAGAYLNSSNDGKGAVYTANLEAAVDATVIDRENFDLIYVLIGETDSVAVNAGTITEAQHKAAYLTLMNLLRADFPDARIVCIPLIADTNGNEFTGWGKVRRAQYELVRDHDWLYPAPAMYDLSMADDLHLDQAGYEAMAARLAEVGAAYSGKRAMAGTLGPQAVSAVYDPDNEYLEVTIEHDGGIDFTISEHRGQNVEVNGTGVAGNSGGTSRINSNLFRVNFAASTFADGDDVVYTWPWGTLKSYTRTNVLIDNAVNPLPLRPSFDITAQKKTLNS